MNIVSGGIPGLAIVLKFLLPFEFITVDILVFALTWGLFFMGLIVLGKAFALKTLISTIIYPPAVSLFMRLVDPEVLGGFFYLAGNEYSDLAVIISACMGGVFVGLGCALTFIGGGSTGGLDIFAFSLCKFFPKLKSSVVIFAVDATVVILGVVAIKNLIILLLGILSAFIAAMMIDKVFIGGRSAFVAHIVTDKHEEINEEIISRLDRTTTSMKVSGGFSREGKTMLMISFSMSQYAEMLAIVSKHDPKAFVVIHRAHAINGEGWDKLG
jgi:uncharacterized membrane-anchored protein YitT (DUF2179 family)